MKPETHGPFYFVEVINRRNGVQHGTKRVKVKPKTIKDQGASAPDAYFTVTATDLRTNRRVVLGGSEDRSQVEAFFARDWPASSVQYLYFFTDPAIHTDHDGFAHAIRVIERGQDPAQARVELAARGY